MFPTAGRSDRGVWAQIVWSAKLAVLNPAKAFMTLVLFALPVLLMIFVPTATMWVPFVWLIVGGGVTMWLVMLMTRRLRRPM
ncbi:hypothetical protein [Bifidobacterium magnum]|uniref:Uncharacterized protein n=1 Tax=Bifidobacterium magnum TaxID=1692 RepID=A0A087BB13_9BIFI|nr:hypothetical protein [Bifidobacterium magnum]KFI68213.1 hypothetical protein BMAGN_0162 [Bifidobacterium magnum]